MTLQILSTTRKLGLMTLEKKQSLPKRVTTSMEYVHTFCYQVELVRVQVF